MDWIVIGVKDYSIYDLLGNSSMIKPMNYKAGSTIYETDTKNKYIFDGVKWIATEEKYRDLGEVINATNIAAGAITYSDTYYCLQWVRNLVILAKSSQQFDIAFLGIDTSGLSGAWTTTLQGLNGPAGGVWIPLKLTTILGYSGKFAIKNISASTASFANLKMQLLGV